MKRYLIFAAVVPLVGGFWLLLSTSAMSGYWSHPPASAQAEKLVGVFARTLQYSYLFGVIPALMLAATDDILFHVKRLGAVVRMLIVGVVAFVVAEILYGSRGPDHGIAQFILYGFVGFIPAILASWLTHRIAEQPATA